MTDVVRLQQWLLPYIETAEMVLRAGAFGFPQVEQPSRPQIMEVALTLMQHCGELGATEADAVRRALTTPAGQRMLHAAEES